jgi:hypothetical protein
MAEYDEYLVLHNKIPVGLFSSVVDAIRLTKNRKDECEVYILIKNTEKVAKYAI